MTTRRAFFGLLAGFGLGSGARAGSASPKAAISLTLRGRDVPAVRAALEQLGPAGRATFDRLEAAVQSFGGSIDRMALRTMASASLPPEMAWSGSTSSAMTRMDSAMSSVSVPFTFSAPINVPHSDAKAAICCCSRVHSAIESSIGSVAPPMLEGVDSSRNGSVGASIAAASPVPPAAAIDGEGRPTALPVTPFLGTAAGPEFLAYLAARAAHENSAGHHPDAALYALHSENDDTLHGQDDSHGGLLDGENHQRARAKFLRDRAISQRG